MLHHGPILLLKSKPLHLRALWTHGPGCPRHFTLRCAAWASEILSTDLVHSVSVSDNQPPRHHHSLLFFLSTFSANADSHQINPSDVTY